MLLVLALAHCQSLARGHITGIYVRVRCFLFQNGLLAQPETRPRPGELSGRIRAGQINKMCSIWRSNGAIDVGTFSLEMSSESMAVCENSVSVFG